VVQNRWRVKCFMRSIAASAALARENALGGEASLADRMTAEVGS